jgi:hypothetical protein
MEFFIRLEKELQKITMYCDFDVNKYKELQDMCLKLGINFKSFTIDLNNITHVEILNMFEFIKLKNNNYCNICNVNEDIYLEDEDEFDIDIYSEINIINEEFAIEYFNFCLKNLEIDLGWRAKPIKNFYMNRPSLKKN